jgi:hypothetical protein
VPRNFILDPAKYGRPARQPWVQAYPVLRAATAMTAFFLIFAFAAGIFTNLGRAEPAADVAQVEATSVEREAMETLAFEAEARAETEEDAEEPAAEEAADESTLEESVDLFEEEMEEVAEEMAEEEATPSPEATAVPSTTNSVQGDTAEDGATVAEPIVPPTPTISPTPTVSTLPRVTPPTPLPERDMDQAAGGEAANDAVAEVSEMEDDTTTAETTVVLPEEDVQELAGGPLFDPLLVLQIGLGVLLLLLAGLTLYARRQR